ncbi:TRAP transporter substrate-binding protein DctP [Microbacterium aquimaris]|uniref:TRAP transporter substrate-binding protein DctP n=1 Tax=Microbacterium aquimaris TaxID=459816 RepID=UPI002AD46CA3|nr:TRAP transporter substrate-binding protein DctP [Microbacterium aquimaris]MDZ8275044.1 TRAP transporter substrate-binding protein DctP [Microbacterium aquimaris]
MYTRLRTVRTVAAMGIAAVTVAALAGCSRADVGGDTESTGEALPAGSSPEEFQEALADMEPVELVFQTPSISPDSVDSVPTVTFIERVEEYSGGKITLDTAWASGIVANPVEVDKALEDGRIDIASGWPQYNPSEYPVTNLLVDLTITRDPQLIQGWYATMAAMNEATLQTPEAMAEYTDKGITPLAPMSPDGPSVFFCTEPLTSLADLEGKQVRSGSVVASRQIEALGAVPVSMPFTEIYEALQRGILDCSLSGHGIATSSGHTEVAPYVINPTTASFAPTPTNFYAGPAYESLPVPAQQIILESLDVMRGMQIEGGFVRVADVLSAAVAENGGEFLAFDPEVDERLAEVNDEIIADVAATDLLDGEELVKRVEDANARWLAEVEGLGYVDEGPVEDVSEWFEPTDPTAWTDAVSVEITQPRFS